jgi:nitrogen fixation protein NifU and related proteins
MADESPIDRLRAALGDILVEHLIRPRRRGELREPDGRGRAVSSCGHDHVEIQVQVRGGDVLESAFVARGCAHTQACASAAADLIADQPLAAARRAASAEGISHELGELPAEKLHCAELVATAVRAALDDAVRTSAEPWRKLYRR